MKTTLSLAIPVLAAMLAATPAAAAPVKLAATLSGANEPAGGDPDGTGAFSAEVDADAGDFCYTLSVAKIDKATMAHVHSGEAGTSGPPVITINVTGADGDECAAVEPDKLKEILANPAGYYVNVHNAAFPAGAVRGQLEKK